jgi:hypothetical protein
LSLVFADVSLSCDCYCCCCLMMAQNNFHVKRGYSFPWICVFLIFSCVSLCRLNLESCLSWRCFASVSLRHLPCLRVPIDTALSLILTKNKRESSFSCSFGFCLYLSTSFSFPSVRIFFYPHKTYCSRTTTVNSVRVVRVLRWSTHNIHRKCSPCITGKTRQFIQKLLHYFPPKTKSNIVMNIPSHSREDDKRRESLVQLKWQESQRKSRK